MKNGKWRRKLAVLAGVVLGGFLLGCRGAGTEPIPARPIAVQPVALAEASAAGATAIPVAVASAPTATSVASVEVRTADNIAQWPRLKAVLIVQNHSGAANTPFPLSTLGDWLQTALGAGSFAVINPHDAIGAEQNVGPWGEKMPESSATRLAENLEAPVLLTASVTSARVREIGGTDSGVQAVLECTLSAKVLPSGEGMASVTASAKSKKESSAIAFNRKAANTWNEMAKETAFSAAGALETMFAKAGVVRHEAAETARVAFSANVAGANVRIDGVSYGTAGPEARTFAVSKGLHNLEVAYPGLVGFKDVVKIQNETTFEIRLALTAEGEAARKKDALFAATMDRMEKSGATDDLVREIVASGYAQYLSASHVQLHGMPKTLVLPEFVPLSKHETVSPTDVDVLSAPSTEEFTDRARELAE